MPTKNSELGLQLKPPLVSLILRANRQKNIRLKNLLNGKRDVEKLSKRSRDTGKVQILPNGCLQTVSGNENNFSGHRGHRESVILQKKTKVDEVNETFITSETKMGRNSDKFEMVSLSTSLIMQTNVKTDLVEKKRILQNDSPVQLRPYPQRDLQQKIYNIRQLNLRSPNKEINVISSTLMDDDFTSRRVLGPKYEPQRLATAVEV